MEINIARTEGWWQYCKPSIFTVSVLAVSLIRATFMERNPREYQGITVCSIPITIFQKGMGIKILQPQPISHATPIRTYTNRGQTLVDSIIPMTFAMVIKTVNTGHLWKIINKWLISHGSQPYTKKLEILWE